MKKGFVVDANGTACQFSAPVAGIVSAVVDSAACTLLEADAHYTVIGSVNFWWRWGLDPLFFPYTVVAGDDESGLWPANKELKIFVKTSSYFSHIKDKTKGYISFYRNY